LFAVEAYFILPGGFSVGFNIINLCNFSPHNKSYFLISYNSSLNQLVTKVTPYTPQSFP
jgi:hypothetical protein